MSDATSHEILAIDVEADDPLDGVSVDVVRSGLESDDGDVRRHAARVAEVFASHDPAGAASLVPTLTERLDDEQRAIVTKSAIALSIVAEESPEALEAAVPDLVELLADDLSLVRLFAARALGYVSFEHPEFLLGTEDALVAALDVVPQETIDSKRLREQAPTLKNFESLNRVNVEEHQRQIAAKGAAANLLVEIAKLEPRRLHPHVDRLLDALDDERSGVVLSCLHSLSEVARDDPDAASAALEPACDLLATENDALAASAVQLLGHLDDARGVDPLRALADDDERDGDLRELASETAAYLERD